MIISNWQYNLVDILSHNLLLFCNFYGDTSESNVQLRNNDVQQSDRASHKVKTVQQVNECQKKHLEGNTN